MPGEWEIENVLNPVLSDDRNIISEDGYSILEKYLNNIVPNQVSQKLCPGACSFILISTVHGTTYQWEENTGYGFVSVSGETDSLITLQLPTPAYGYRYRCRVNNNRYSLEFKIKFENSWVGAVDNTWENAANWNCNIVPDRYTEVTIPSGNATVNSNPECRSIRVNAAMAQVTVNAGYNYWWRIKSNIPIKKLYQTADVVFTVCKKVTGLTFLPSLLLPSFLFLLY